MSTTSEQRDMQLIDGRRVQIKDLIDAGLLTPGSILRFVRPRLGKEYTAEVTEEGRLRLADGREFAAPSRAAMEAADIRAIDGWSAWSVDGVDLFSLREQLVSQGAGSSTTDGDGQERDRSGDDTFSTRQARLAALRRSAASDTPESLTVRQLLVLWEARGRGHRVVDHVLADLDNHGLITEPDFRKVSLDSLITLLAAPSAQQQDDASGPASDAEPQKDGDELDVGLTLGNLASASAGVTSVNPGDSIAKAMTLMRMNDFSQLPVMTSTREIKGSVTWKSIAKALAHSQSPSLTDALEPTSIHAYDEDLVDVLGVLYKNDFLFVRDSKREINGVVTTADVVRLYGETATPFFVIGEIDHLLRGAVSDTWTVNQVVSVCDPDGTRGIESHDDLSFGDYQRMMEGDERFASLGWPLDRATFIKRLDEVREIRNGVAHFDLDPQGETRVELLVNFLKLMRDLRSWDER